MLYKRATIKENKKENDYLHHSAAKTLTVVIFAFCDLSNLFFWWGGGGI